jgi:hypothetical protein
MVLRQQTCQHTVTGPHILRTGSVSDVPSGCYEISHVVRNVLCRLPCLHLLHNQGVRSEMNGDRTKLILQVIGLVVAVLACIAAYLALIPEDKRWPFQAEAATTQSITISPTDTLLLPTDTLIPTKTPMPPSPTETAMLSPVEAVEHYYQLLNSGDYEQAWAMFTPNFQENQQADNIDEYKDWAGLVQEVVIVDRKVLRQTDTEATVVAHLIYKMQNGTPRVYESFYICLERETGSHDWLFDRTCDRTDCCN